MAITVGSVEVDVIPNTQGIHRRLTRELVTAATSAGEDAGSAAGRAFGPAMSGAIDDTVATRIGQQLGEQIAARITATIRDSMRNGITQGGAAARPAAVRQGDETGGAFSRALKTRLEAAFRSLPKINIDANTSEADADLQALRVRMETLASKRIGIDIDAGTAKAEIKLLEAELQRLGAQHPNVQVRADTAAATAELVAVRAQIDAVDGKRARIDVDTSGALSAVIHLATAIGGLAVIPAIPVLAAGIGSIASAAVAAGAGVGALAAVAIPAFVGIAGALQAQKAAQEAATSATGNGGQAAAAAARQGLQLAGAQQALATAHRNAARQIAQAQQAVGDAHRDGARRVAQAQQGVQDAVSRAAEANESAAKQVRSSREALASVYEQAAERMRNAGERVAQAEESLADAQRTARQAQLDLTQARKDAAVELAELGDRLANAQLSERDAVLSVQEAHDRLQKVNAVGSKASAVERQRAQLGYDQAVQRLKEQQAETKNLSAEKKAADKAGVEGSDTVKQAQERIAEADKGIAEQQKALAKAREESARQQIDNQQDIAKAQEKVAESQRNVSKAQEDGARSVARAQQQVSLASEEAAQGVARSQQRLAEARQSAADSIASAERQIQSASLSSAGGADAAATAQAKYQAALAKLTPAARQTFNAFVSLKGAFGEWSKSLQPQVMPIFTRALNGIKNSLPGLTPFVVAAAKAIGNLQDRVSAGFKSPWWLKFKKDLAGSVQPAIEGLGISFGRIFKGMAGVVGAFLPHMDSISGIMQRITGRFANWASNLKGSPEFERFLSYSADMGPVVASALRDMLGAVLRLAQALAPVATITYLALAALARAIGSIAEHLPWLIQLLYLAWIATKLWTLAMVVFNLVMSANPVVLIVLAILALVAAVIYAYKNFGWFRDIVNAVWSAIQTAAMWAWNNVLKPIFDAFAAAFRVIADVAMWLWNTVLSPVFSFIGTAAKILITIIVTLLVLPYVLAFKAMAAIASWLWENVLSPVFGWIADKAVWLWQEKIKPTWDLMRIGFGLVADKIKELWNTYVKPIFNWIGEKAVWLWYEKIKPAWELFKIGMGLVGDKIKELWNDYAKPIFNFIGDKAAWLWEKALKPPFDKIKSAVALVGDAFGLAKDAIGEAWGKIQNIAKKPTNFIIKWVYTKGIKAVWDKVAGFVGLGKLPAAPKLLAAGGTVGNGFGPARPMVTNRPTAIVGEGNPRYPEFVIPTDPKYRNRAQALHAAAGTRLMAKGGILGGAWDWTKDTVSDVVGKGIDWAKKGADLLGNPSKVWNTLMKPILSKVAGGVGNSKMGDAIGKFPAKMVGGLKDKIVAAAASVFGGDGAGGGQWLKPVNGPYGTRFGVAGSMWSSGRHTGLDIPAAVGAAIRAVADGTVTQVASGGPYGKHVQLSHGGGLSSFYAHMSSIAARMGGRVSAGQTIGQVGATGNVTGPHLHLEARRNGRAVDPMPFLTGGGGFTGRAVGAAQRTAQGMLGRYGWGANQFGPLKQLWQHESGWRWNATNPSSGAYGIPQSLPASKMASAGADWRTNPATQIKWGMGYIKGRYGSPASAWDFWNRQSPHWYDSGGYLQPGLNLAYNGTGRPEPVFTSQQANALTRLAAEPAAGGFAPGQPVTLMVKDGPTLQAYVADVADGRVDAGLTQVRRTLERR